MSLKLQGLSFYQDACLDYRRGEKAFVVLNVMVVMAGMAP